MRSTNDREEIKKLYRDNMKCLEDILKAMTEVVEEGKTDTEVCRKYGLNLKWFRKVSRTNGYGEISDDYPAKNMVVSLFWEERFLKELTGEDIAPQSDFMQAYEAVSKRLPEKLADYLDKHFRQEMTLEEIAEEEGVTRAYIGMQIIKAFRKLRTPHVMKYFVHGYEKSLQEEKIQDEYHAEEKEYVWLTIKAEELSAKNKKLREILGLTGENTHMINRGIEDLNLTVRTYNCLKRAGINNADEIEKLDFRKLCGIRNLGRRSISEIIGKMRELGYNDWADKMQETFDEIQGGSTND